MLACFRRGLIWRGIKHDWSKFLPDEWFPYSQYFYGGELPTFKESMRNFNRSCGVSAGELTKEVAQEQFDRAWLKHQHRNDHHWQNWILRLDSGETVLMPMPTYCVKEMLADWEGAGMAITGKKEYHEWYQKNADKMQLNPRTRKLVELLLERDTKRREKDRDRLRHMEEHSGDIYGCK